MRTTILALRALTVLHADYTLGRDSQPQAGIPKGAVTKYTLNPGRSHPVAGKTSQD